MADFLKKAMRELECCSSTRWTPPFPVEVSRFQLLQLSSECEAEVRRSKMATDGDLSDLFEALEMEDDGKEKLGVVRLLELIPVCAVFTRKARGKAKVHFGGSNLEKTSHPTNVPDLRTPGKHRDRQSSSEEAWGLATPKRGIPCSS